MEQAVKDFLQLGFSFFVAGYLLVVTQKTMTMMAEKLTQVIDELRHLNEKLDSLRDTMMNKPST